MLYATSDHRICRDMPRTLYSSCLPLRGGRRSRDTIQLHIAALAPPALTPSNTWRRGTTFLFATTLTPSASVSATPSRSPANSSLLKTPHARRMTASPRNARVPVALILRVYTLFFRTYKYSTGTSFFLGKYSNGAVALHLHSHYTGDDVVHSHNYPYTFSRYTARSPEPVS
ncbi:hypothetical protein B0H14DRAFT_3032234 [Mycena olivaceomarginata]|nr:hypothetical protein B0H14DRAFT_3032234 [Mycena olivaceomarginata]